MDHGNGMNELHRILAPVRTRQRCRCALRGGVVGLLVGSLTAILLGGARLLLVALPLPVIAALPIVGLLAGLLWGLGRPRRWKEAAQAVDTHYHLKDRAVTALAFLDLAEPGVFHRLQIADAVAHLDRLDRRAVVPLGMPRVLPYAGLAVGLAIVLMLIPAPGQLVSAGPPAPRPEIVAESQQLEATMIQELEQWSKEHPKEKVKELLQKLKQLVREMKDPGVDQREVLAKLSEMQAAIAESIAEYNLDAADAGLKALGEALESVDAMRGASASLQKGDHRRAADQLDALDPASLDRKQSKAAGGKLKKLAKDLGEGGQGSLGKTVTELDEALESSESCSSEKTKAAMRKLAGQCRKQAARKDLRDKLTQQLASLGECKSRCGACQGTANGGNQTAKSSSPSQSWGVGATGTPLGDHPTSIAAQRHREEISGAPGEGPAEREVSQALPERQLAGRSYREMYQQYRKMSEAVLQSEPLPLGYRQTIRRYFELIRPQDLESPPGSPQVKP